MKISVIISLLIHLVIFYCLLTLFEVVPNVDLPNRIYSVQIFSPRKQEKKPPAPTPEVKSEKEPVKEEVPEKKPEEKPEVKPEKKPEKPEPEPEPEDNGSMDVSVNEEKEGTSIAVDAPRFPFSYYLGAIQRKVSGNWFSKPGEHGKTVSCVVYFRLSRGGGISGLRVEKRSGDPFFDRAALRAIRSSEPFPPLPKAFTEPSLGIHFKFVQRD
ncbi:MAG: TonB family protein [Candidatus Latescibacteria bacterium]|nr:TonB family protein [bacterium]MBD3425214.1 TonB family protein [Candidatus Latescibacterota bacterium]